MNTFLITEDRMNEVLPKTIKEAECLSENAKKVFAAIMNGIFTNDTARDAGFLAISNEALRANAGIGKDYFKTARQELLETVPTILEIIPGRRRQKGLKSMATEYYPKWENLDKPIRRKTFQELMEMVCKPSEKPISPAILYYTNPNTDSESDTESDSESINIKREIGSHAPFEEGAAPKKVVKKTKEELEEELEQHKTELFKQMDEKLKGVPYSRITEVANAVFSHYTTTAMSLFDENQDKLKKIYNIRLNKIKEEATASMSLR